MDKIWAAFSGEITSKNVAIRKKNKKKQSINLETHFNKLLSIAHFISFLPFRNPRESIQLDILISDNRWLIKCHYEMLSAAPKGLRVQPGATLR